MYSLHNTGIHWLRLPFIYLPSILLRVEVLVAKQLHMIGYVKLILWQIADFGMSRDLMDESCYVSHGGKIPVKWTAPEVCVQR